MRKTSSLLFGALLAAVTSAIQAQDSYTANFRDSTLRVDCVFGGSADNANIMVHSRSKTPGWAGRRHNLDRTPLAGNGTIMVVDPATADTIYRQSFSSLFQEWLATPEAQQTSRSFENTFLVPLPAREADIVVSLRDNRNREIARTVNRYLPGDELVSTPKATPLPHSYIHRGSSANPIDVAILAEGYTTQEMDTFLQDARRIVDEILSYEPFKSEKENFNFVAVMSPSAESGVSVPLEGIWKDTGFGSHYSTFHSARYLTAPKVWKMHDSLQGVPYEHVMILVNTDRYGGGGIYNSYHISAAHNKLTLPVAVHEFGHSFGGLADEYFYIDEQDGTYADGIEPWEQNITTLVDFDSKWKDLVDPSTPIPTPWDMDGDKRDASIDKKSAANDVIGAYEGGGYRAKGVYRPMITCRMRDNFNPTFCPVCERSLRALIEFYTH